MKDMKNIKPAYAVNLGTGVFAGARWQCIRCGQEMISYSRPGGMAGSRCPETSSGNHIWQEC